MVPADGPTLDPTRNYDVGSISGSNELIYRWLEQEKSVGGITLGGGGGWREGNE